MSLPKQAEYLSEEIVILALRNHYNNLDLASAELGIRRHQLVDYIAAHPNVVEAKRDIQEAVKDGVEKLLMERMKTSDSLLMFYMKTQMKDRGYGDSTSHTGPNGGAIEVNINARMLIAKLRDGTLFDEEQQQKELPVLDESGSVIDGVGTVGDSQMLSESSLLYQ